MFKDIINRSKNVADKLACMILNFSEVEIKVFEATNDDQWGPHPELMEQIAIQTRSHDSYMEIITLLWRRMTSETQNNWRRVYKSLILLVFLLKNGSEYVAAGAADRIYDLRALESYQFRDEHGRDQGINVRIKVKEVIDLLLDRELLRSERKKALQTKKKYTGFGSDDLAWRGGLQTSSTSSRYNSNWSDNDDDKNAWSPPPPTSNSSSSSRNHQQSRSSEQSSAKTVEVTATSGLKTENGHRLGSFEDWNVGKERGAIDEVVEHVKEAWGLTKLTTREIFSSKDEEPSHDFNTFDSRYTSEEMYAFPDAAEVAEDENYQRVDSARSSPELDVPWRRRNRNGSSPAGNNKSEPSQVKSDTTHSKRKIQVPSLPEADLFDEISQRDMSEKPADIDFFGSAAPTTTPLANTTNEALLLDFGQSPPVNHTTSQPITNQQPSLMDFDEFCDFKTATPSQQPNQGLIFPHMSAVPVIQPCVADHLEQSWTDLMSSSQPTMLPAKTNADPITMGMSTGAHQNGSSSQAVQPEPTPVSKVPERWKEIDALGINLDSLVMPEKLGPKNKPTLRQLQQK